MFSIFNHTPNHVNLQQENNVAARKPGLSTRKPFAERKINANVEKPSVVQTKHVKTVKEPELPNDILDFYACSYKDTPENYADIQGSYENISSILFGNIPKTPPPKNKHSSEPDFIETGKSDNYFDSIFDKIRLTNILNNGLEQFDDSNMPILDFDPIF